MKRLLTTLIATVLLGYPAEAQTKTDKERDGLAGPVLVVRSEKARCVNESGLCCVVSNVESPFFVL
jgi:hypothetical protein